ncbi:MAG: cysteine hydrolase [Spirochaetales bacterium]|nr:cysteine hydrolase [Spirochaetales bacterium]
MTKKIFLTLSLLFLFLGGCAGIPEFRPDNTALLIIDIQNSYLPVSGQKAFVANVKELITRAREAGVPVIYIAHTTQYITRNTQGWEFHRNLKPLETDIIVEKRHPSAFIETDLEKILKDLHVSNLVLTGLASSACYGATARDAAEKGFMTIVVSDAHADPRAGKAEELNTALEGSDNPLLMMTADILFVR